MKSTKEQNTLWEQLKTLDRKIGNIDYILQFGGPLYVGRRSFKSTKALREYRTKLDLKRKEIRLKRKKWVPKVTK